MIIAPSERSTKKNALPTNSPIATPIHAAFARFTALKIHQAHDIPAIRDNKDQSFICSPLTTGRAWVYLA